MKKRFALGSSPTCGGTEGVSQGSRLSVPCDGTTAASHPPGVHAAVQLRSSQHKFIYVLHAHAPLRQQTTGASCCCSSSTMHICKGGMLRALSKNAHNPVHNGCPQSSFCQGVREAQDHLRDRECPGRIESAAVLLEEDRQAPNLQGSQVG